MSDTPIVNIEKTVALREAEMTTNSTMTDLERRVEDAIVRVLGEHRTWYGPLFVNEVARAALKAHAEYLEEQGLVVMPQTATFRLVGDAKYRGQVQMAVRKSATKEEQP